MKHLKLYIAAALSIAGLAACQPEKYTLGDTDVTKDDLVVNVAFSVTPDASDPNTIYLESLMPSKYTVLWEHPQGYSQATKVTLKLPFKGTYDIKFGVMTRGGAVYGDPYQLVLTTDNLSYVNDDFWTMLTGGAGNSKTWMLDLDAEGNSSRMFKGPMWFFTDGFCWDNFHTAKGESYLDSYYDENASWVPDNAIVPNSDWYWSADWAGNSWMCGAADFGTLTFDLIGGANMTVDDGTGPVSCPFTLDATKHQISFSGLLPLHPSDVSVVSESVPSEILYLDENFFQLTARREDGQLISLNYVWTGYEEPVVVEDVDITLPEDWREYFEPKTNNQPKYKLSADEPFDWFTLDGTRKNLQGSFTPVEDLGDVTFAFNKVDNSFEFCNLYGEISTGTYTLDDPGIYTFSDELPAFSIDEDGAIEFTTNADNTLRILAYEVDDYSGAMTEMWLGKQVLDAAGDLVQYLGYHFITVIAGADDTPHYNACLYFNNSGWGWTHEDVPAVDGGDANARSAVVDITGDGDYTFSFDASFAESDMYLMYLDIFKILKKYPNADAVITDIKIDGQSIAIDDSLIDRGVGDSDVTMRRYVLNPWNSENYFMLEGSPSLAFSSSFALTIHVTMDTGTPFISED